MLKCAWHHMWGHEKCQRHTSGTTSKDMIGLRCPRHDQPHPFPCQLEVPAIVLMRMPCLLHIAWQMDAPMFSIVMVFHQTLIVESSTTSWCNIVMLAPEIPPLFTAPSLHWVGWSLVHTIPMACKVAKPEGKSSDMYSLIDSIGYAYWIGNPSINNLPKFVMKGF